MKKINLGKTGIMVTELCFGALPLGPLQLDLSVEEGAKLIRSALEEGINFIDTAEGYETYPHIKRALEGYKGEVIIATKSHAESYEEMENSIYKALIALNRDYIDIFHLHAARATAAVFEERSGALNCLKDYKAKGLIRAVGISTHAIEIVQLATKIEEIEVIFPIINKMGLGIVDGSASEMVQAISNADKAGKGLYAMKALAGGRLIDELETSINYVRHIDGINSVAVGMVSEAELALNIKLFNNEKISQELFLKKVKPAKKLFISRFCEGCGTCVETCPNHALSLVEGMAVVNHDLCILCGYCNPVCPKFAIRIV